MAAKYVNTKTNPTCQKILALLGTKPTRTLKELIALAGKSESMVDICLLELRNEGLIHNGEWRISRKDPHWRAMYVLGPGVPPPKPPYVRRPVVWTDAHRKARISRMNRQKSGEPLVKVPKEAVGMWAGLL